MKGQIDKLSCPAECVAKWVTDLFWKDPHTRAFILRYNELGSRWDSKFI